MAKCTITKDVITCEFIQVDEYHVKCTSCGRTLSGTPERYDGKYPCSAKGIGTDFTNLMEWWANVLRIEYTKCASCISLEKLMNQNGARWVRANHDAIVQAVHNNAVEQGLKIPKFGISRMLKKAEKISDGT